MKSLGQVDVSPSDKRHYEAIELPNGLRALLIHDPEIESFDQMRSRAEEERNGCSCSGHAMHGTQTDHCDDCDDKHDCETSSGEEDSDDDSDSQYDDDDQCCEEEVNVNGRRTGKQMEEKKRAAAAICVGVGSYSDPIELPGLSHYLEHMLFMGSEKFPDENEYDSYLSHHNGSSNAYTEEENTVFHFECTPAALEGALDRFSQFFVAPLLKTEALEREVLAVDDEFAGIVQEDSCRLAQSRALCAVEGHPAQKFGWGNKRSLQTIPASMGIDVRQRLDEYFQRHYGAERMTLVILSGEDMSIMKAWVKSYFSDIRHGVGPRPRFDDAGFPFASRSNMSIISSVKDQQKISILFQLPSSLEKQYLKKAEDYVSHLVGHEGKGSLLAGLKKREWATELSSGVSEQTSAAWSFEITITLTDLGLQAPPGCGLAVVQMAFQYLEMLRQRSPQKWIWDEMSTISQLKWRFLEEEDPADYVAQTSSDMQLYPIKHVLSWSYLHEIFDPELIANVLGYMTPENAKIDLQTSEYDTYVEIFKKIPVTDVECLHDSWFGFDFVRGKLDPSVWNMDINGDNMTDFRLPDPNPYLPTCFDRQNDNVKGDLDAPVRLDSKGIPSVTTYFKHDDKFNVPKMTCFFRLSSASAHRSPKHVGLTHVFIKLLEDVLCEEAYLADVAGLQYSIWLDGQGMDVRVEGFNHKIQTLTSLIFSTLANFAFKDEDFERVKETVLRHYHNALMKPSNHAQFLRIQTLKHEFWDPRDIYVELQNILAEDVRKFLGELLDECHLLTLVVGNSTSETAVQISHEACRLLKASSSNMLLNDTILKIPKTYKSVIRNEITQNEEEENSCIEYYVQLGHSIAAQDRALLDFIDQMMYEPCYDILRTKKQLGYAVSSGTRLTCGVQGLCISIQSSSFSARHLEMEIESFLEHFDNMLVTMSDEEFEMHRESLIDMKLTKDKNLAEEAERLWDILIHRAAEFDCRTRDVLAIKSLQRKEILNYYRTHIAPGGSENRKLVVYVDPKSRWDDSPAPEGSILLHKEDLADFQSTHDCYPDILSS